MVLKTVAAFLNSDGGTLLIGVTDEGTIHGLRDDYKLLGKKQDADGFENWLAGLLLGTMGKDLARLMSISFATIEGKQICRVDVRRSPRPVFVVSTTGVECLYIRTGNSTRELAVSEALQYCREHFVPVAEPDLRGAAAGPAAGITSGAEAAAAPQRRPAVGTTETKAAPKKANESDEPRSRLTDQYEIEDIVAIVRDVVCSTEPMDRDDVIREIGRQLGAERVGSRIRELIESGLNTASRRSIAYSDARGLRPLCRTIDDYNRDDLKNVLRAVVGRTWTDETEAIRLGARHLGFRRTGSRIEQAFRSAIRGGLRHGTLERNGSLIRAV